MRTIFIPFRRRRAILTTASLICIAILFLCNSGIGKWRTTAASSGEEKPVYEVDTDRQAVAISFDASWGMEHTQEILDILEEHEIDATFFLVNIWLEDYPEMAAEIAAQGHEIGLHSASHPYFTRLNDDEIRQELNSNAEMIRKVTGYSPTVFRPPYGDYDSRVVKLAQGCGYTSVQWSIDSLDWKDLSADEIYQRVTKDVHAGDIVLFHNNGAHTAEALPRILEYYESQGLEVVSVSDLLLQGETYVDINGVQHAGMP